MNQSRDDEIWEALGRLPSAPVPPALAERVRLRARAQVPGRPRRGTIVASRVFAVALATLSFVCLRWAVMFTSDLYR